MTFEEVEKLQNDVRNNKFDYQKLIGALEDYKWLLEWKPSDEIVNTHAVSVEALYDACRAYARWYEYNQCEMGLQKILFFDGFLKENVDDCEVFRHPVVHHNSKYGLGIDEDAWAKAAIERINKEYEELQNRNERLEGGK